MGNVHSPSHYQTDSGLEAIDVIEAFFKENAYLANAFKYLSRCGKKDIADPVEDLEKAKEYIDFAINSYRTGKPRKPELDRSMVMGFRVLEQWESLANVPVDVPTVKDAFGIQYWQDYPGVWETRLGTWIPERWVTFQSCVYGPFSREDSE